MFIYTFTQRAKDKGPKWGFVCYQFYIYIEIKQFSKKKPEKAMVDIDRKQSCMLKFQVYCRS